MASDPHILFHWRAPASDFAQRLIIAAIAAISIHGLCFYVFQVQEPQSARTLPRTFGVTYLSPSDPNARLILQQINDYYAAYEGTLLAESDLHMPWGALDYEASFRQIEPELMPLPEREKTPTEALGPKVSAMVLPDIPPWIPPAEETQGRAGGPSSSGSPED